MPQAAINQAISDVGSVFAIVWDLLGCAVQQSDRRVGLTPSFKPIFGNAMSRFAETEMALLGRLRALKARPEMSINLVDVSTLMHAAGFSTDEITSVLAALEQDKILTYAPGNRVLILREIPD